MSDRNDTHAIHRSGKAREAFRTISEVAESLELPQHVLRFWESKFNQVRPLKRGGNRRYYRPEDVRLLVAIKALLHGEGYTIRGVQKLFKAQGLKATIAQALGEPLDSDAVKRLEGVKPAPSLVDAVQQTEKAAQKQQVVEEKGSQPTEARKKELSDLLKELRSIRSELS